VSGEVFWNQKGWDKILSRCNEMKGLVVKVGVQGDKAAELHDEDGELTNVEVAAIHEFSEPSDKPPGRPFIRPVYDSDPERWKGALADACAGVFAGKSPNGALRKIGEDYRAAVIERMKEGIAPPLSEKTINRRKGQNTQGKRDKIERKGGSLDVTPLIDTGMLMGSISVSVEKK
jgi:hypothetical protein